MDKKVAIVTGASSGIGKQTALELLNRGFIVYGGARRTELMQEIEKAGAHIDFLDVTNDSSMNDFVHCVLKAEGRIDVLVNNAGYGLSGALEEIPISEAKAQFEVNVFGLARMIQLVLPTMRAQRSGTIINISSIAGKLSSPFMNWYHASKYSVEALSDAVRMETKPFGIKVVIIEPGLIQTSWGTKMTQYARKYSEASAYKENIEQFAAYYEKKYKSSKNILSSPDVVSKTIGKVVCTKNPKIRYTVGKNAKLFVFLKTILPNSLYQFALEKMMKLKKN